MKENLRLILIGLQGVGKSAAGNTILGREEFLSDISPASLTLKSEKREADVGGRSVTVVDTPGLKNSDVNVEEELQRALSLCDPGPHAFLLVIQLGRFTEQERRVMDTLRELLCLDVNCFTIVLFTYGDKLKNKTLDQFVREDKNLQSLIKKCGSLYHVFNNTDSENRSQVSELFEIVDSLLRNRDKEPYYVRKTGKQENPWIKRMLYIAAAGAICLLFHCLKTPKPSEMQADYTQSFQAEEIVQKQIEKDVTQSHSNAIWQPLLELLHTDKRGYVLAIAAGIPLFLGLRRLIRK